MGGCKEEGVERQFAQRITASVRRRGCSGSDEAVEEDRHGRDVAVFGVQLVFFCYRARGAVRHRDAARANLLFTELFFYHRMSAKLERLALRRDVGRASPVFA